MPKAKLVKKGKDFVVLQVPSYTAVTGEMAEKYLHGNIKSILFRFPSPKALPENGVTFQRVDPKYATKLLFRCDSGLKQLGKRPAKPLVRLVIPASGEELGRESRRTLTRFSLDTGGSYMSDRARRGYEKYIRDIAPKTNSIFIMKDGKILGMFSIVDDWKDGGKKCRLLAWSYIDASLSKAERADAHYQASRWLIKNTAGLQVIAGIYAANARSQKFHFKLGMRPVAVAIKPMREK
jgi:hypothetical protein